MRDQRRSTVPPRGNFIVKGDISEVRVFGEWDEERGQSTTTGVIVTGKDLVTEPRS